MEMGKIIGKPIRSEHFWILQFWEFFCQPFGENTFSKNAPKTTNEKLKKISSVLSNQITARELFGAVPPQYRFLKGSQLSQAP